MTAPYEPPELPENAAVDKIYQILCDMDGMTNCMALGILESVKQMIYENIHTENQNHPEF